MLNLSYGLKGKNIIVTGAAGGLGSSVAKSFAASGANLLLTDIDLKKKTLNRLSKSLKKKYNIKCHILLLDISNRDDVSANLEISINGFTKKIDCLANCAAIYHKNFWEPIGTKNIEGWDKIIDINLFGTLNIIRQVLPKMIKQKSGNIISITSDSGVDTIPGESAYGISKAAINKLMVYLARENPKSGIRFNSIAPGYIDTPLLRSLVKTKKIEKEAINSIPISRFAKPQDIANVVLFLASDKANYINGECLVVNGGRY
jgi:3-oxoacyl-[acyl-carrier protein] reductase